MHVVTFTKADKRTLTEIHGYGGILIHVYLIQRPHKLLYSTIQSYECLHKYRWTWDIHTQTETTYTRCSCTLSGLLWSLSCKRKYWPHHHTQPCTCKLLQAYLSTTYWISSCQGFSVCASWKEREWERKTDQECALLRSTSWVCTTHFFRGDSKGGSKSTGATELLCINSMWAFGSETDRFLLPIVDTDSPSPSMLRKDRPRRSFIFY